ncbi:MAG: alkaline phosphatase D family protein [Acidimicrobiales bacterium]
MSTLAVQTAVFVPAIMSVGLLVSIVTLMLDALRWTRRRSRQRRSVLEARSVISELTGEPTPPEEFGVLPRPTYLLSAAVLVAGAAYVSIGSAANFLKDGGYVSDIAWLLAVALGLAVVLGFLGGVAVAVFWSWPSPPPWTVGALRRAPLTALPGDNGGPSWNLKASLALTALATGVLAMMVATGRGLALEIDRPILDWLVESDTLDRLRFFDPFGSTVVSIGLVLLIAASAFRCRVMALAYPAAFVLSWVSTVVLAELVERQRPYGFGQQESFPSGHMVHAVLIAGLVPLALQVLLSKAKLVSLARVVLWGAVLVTALHRVHRQDHWPLDALAGTLAGLTVVLLTYWVIEHRSWHRSCSSCPWSEHPGHTPWGRGVFDLPPRVAQRLGQLGIGLGLVAATALAVGTLTIGLPADPEGVGFASAVTAPVQIGFAALMVAAAAIATRWKGVAAFLMAFAATGLGVAASVQYSPAITFALAASLLLPSILLWFAWQPNETYGSVAVLAVVTAIALTGTVLGSREIYGHFYGPSHPESSTAEPGWHAQWLWLGGVTPNSASVVAGGLPPRSEATISYSSDGGDVAAISATSDRYGIARFDLRELSPATAYSYEVASDGRVITAPSDAIFTTHKNGSQDLTVVLGACARSESNGAVFDAMRAEDPDLYLALGDLHYGNLESTDPKDHVTAYGRSIGQPAQAALFSSVPTAYVWDDHDYGPNDSGADSPARQAVGTAYRAAVPHHGVAPNPDSGIAQAFTVGRVRFVLTDTRSHRTESTMLGSTQLEWLLDELLTSTSTHALVVWANPTPWVAEPGTSADNWSAYPAERQLIAQSIADAGITNLLMVSGDAHMVAIDDGSNTGYATDRTAGFPLLHAGALDRPGSVKGGPYSEGAFPGGGQFGKLEIRDDGGDSIGVALSGHTWQGQQLLSYEYTITG